MNDPKSKITISDDLKDQLREYLGFAPEPLEEEEDDYLMEGVQPEDFCEDCGGRCRWSTANNEDPDDLLPEDYETREVDHSGNGATGYQARYLR